MTDSLIQLFTRDLNALKKEINSYTNEEQLWLVDKEINNSAGNLCLHLIGNLNHFIGAILGNSRYVREREFEFSLKNVPISIISKKIDDVIILIEKIISNLSETDLKANYPLEVFGHKMTTQFFLIHLTTHLSYHLGQINYHRRLLV